jgi:hypothetical protein
MQSHHLGLPFQAVGDGTSSAVVVVVVGIVPVNKTIVSRILKKHIKETYLGLETQMRPEPLVALGVSYCFLSLPFGPLSWVVAS